MKRSIIILISLIGGFLFILEGSKYLITRSEFFGWLKPVFSLSPGALGFALSIVGMSILIITSMLALHVKWSRWLALLIGLILFLFYPLGTILGALYLIFLLLIWREEG